ncbi:hypothetical protein ACFE04_009650 [Oxalis oulophora]
MALKGLSRSCFLLIAIAGMERFAFKGVASNLVTYLTDVVKMSNSSAAKMVNTWCGFTSIMPLLVAPLADAYWDRYFTILASSFLYVFGLVALTSTTFVWASNKAGHSISSSFLFWSLCLISAGQGAYNPSLQALGTDQLENDEASLPSSTTKDEKNSNTKSLFFQWWYFGLCTGSLLGVTLMSYIQDNYGWVLGFAIPTGGMIAATLVFSFWSIIYASRNDGVVDKKMIMQNVIQSIKAIASKLCSRKITLLNEKESVELELQEKPLCVGKNSGSIEARNEEKNPKSENHWIENTKVIVRLLPIWTVLLPFAVIFQQPSTFFTKQGMTMQRQIGSSFKVPPATLQSAMTLSIMVSMPLYDKVFIPLTRVITRNEKGVSVLQRIGIGMVLSVIAMVIAALVETKRLEIGKNMKISDFSGGEALPLSICWLLPQYILLGISDIFKVVGMQEFFYSEVPTRMRTMGFALYTSVFGVGSFLSALLITVIEGLTEQSWFKDNMNEARLDKYYWLLAIASALSFLLYVILSNCYKSRSEVENESSN